MCLLCSYIFVQKYIGLKCVFFFLQMHCIAIHNVYRSVCFTTHRRQTRLIHWSIQYQYWRHHIETRQIQYMYHSLQIFYDHLQHINKWFSIRSCLVLWLGSQMNRLKAINKKFDLFTDSVW